MATRRRSGFWNRSTGDIMILMVAVTLCAGVFSIGLATILFAFLNPSTDVSSSFRFVANILNTMIGLLAGYLAGRTDRSASPPAEKTDEAPDQ